MFFYITKSFLESQVLLLSWVTNQTLLIGINRGFCFKIRSENAILVLCIYYNGLLIVNPSRWWLCLDTINSRIYAGYLGQSSLAIEGSHENMQMFHLWDVILPWKILVERQLPITYVFSSFGQPPFIKVKQACLFLIVFCMYLSTIMFKPLYKLAKRVDLY